MRLLKMSEPESRPLNDEELIIRDSLRRYEMAKTAIMEETRSLKVRVRVNNRKIDSLRMERDQAHKRLDTFMERAKFLRGSLLQRITSRAEIPELRLHFQNLCGILQEKQMERARIFDEIRQKQASSEQQVKVFLKQKMHENQLLLEKESIEIRYLEAELRELSEERPLLVQQQAFAEEMKSLEIEMESEVKNQAQTVNHDSCQKKQRELIKQKQELEERAKYLIKKMGYSHNNK